MIYQPFGWLGDGCHLLIEPHLRKYKDLNLAILLLPFENSDSANDDYSVFVWAIKAI